MLSYEGKQFIIAGLQLHSKVDYYDVVNEHFSDTGQAKNEAEGAAPTNNGMFCHCIRR